MTTSGFYLIGHSTTGEGYSCCACTLIDGEGKVMADPKYATFYICRQCGHFCCQQHYMAGLCWGCSCEEGVV